MIERRKNPRRMTFLGGRIVFNHRQSTMDCVVKNLGKGGAKAVFSHTSVVPDNIEIRITRMDRTFSARIAWRREDEVGLVFVADDANVIPLDLALKLRKLEADKVVLQRRVEVLTSGV
jgi:hypothetical protein